MALYSMKKHIQKIILIIALITFAFILVLQYGCSIRNENAEGKTVVSYYTWTGSYGIKLLKENLAQFEKENPTIKVNLINSPEDAASGFVKLKAMLLSGTSPDVVVLYDPLFHVFSTKDVFLDLNPYIAKDSTFNKDDYFPRAYQFCQYQGKQLAIPRGQNTYILYYNKDLFDKAGLKYPDDTWDWKVFLNACQKLTKDTNGDGRPDQYGFRYGGDPSAFIWQNGGDYFNADKTQCTLDKPEVIEALQFITDLINKYKVAPQAAMMKDQDVFQAFMSGKVAMTYGGRFYSRVFQDIKAFKWDVAPPPHGKIRATQCDYTLFAIAKNSKHADAAWKLVSYLSGPEIQKRASKTLDDIPVLKSVAESPEFLDPSLPPANVKEFINAIDYSRCVSERGMDAEMLDKITSQLDMVNINAMTAKDAGKKMTEEVNQILQERQSKR
jgi:multiple sugar transport system substrate-binding protein